MHLDVFLAYLALSFVIIVVPGPNVTLIVATSALRGWRAGLMVVFGATAAMAVQVALVSLGLAWVVERFGHLFDVVRYAGAAYLIYLGIRVWRTGSDPHDAPPQGMRLLRKGFWVGLANPKSLAFFAAFFPQFLDPELSTAPQFAAMMAGFVVLAFVVNFGYALAAGLGHRFATGERFRLWLGRGSGVVLIGGGALLAGVRQE